MMRPSPKGWCPGAHRPMLSGDGWIYRVRPRNGRIDAAQLAGLYQIATTFGNGIIDLTRRANLQIRGVGEDAHRDIVEALKRLRLLDETAAIEERRNILLTPLWQPDDPSDRIARELEKRLAAFPPLPAKFGFAVDTGPRPVLKDSSADIRFERTNDDGVIVCADGMPHGFDVSPEFAVDGAIALATWFHETGGPSARRMHRHLQTTELPAHFRQKEPAAAAPPLHPGPTPIGPALGAPFGQLPADALADLMTRSGAVALRTTPWRLFLLEGGRAAMSDFFIERPDDPLLDVDACPGAPYCPSASVETRTAARRLAGTLPGSIHVSGCSKGCAHPGDADTTLVGRDGRFDLIRNGSPWDGPERTGLDPQALSDVIGTR